MRGATEDVVNHASRIIYFNPRSPCGERLGGDSVVQREGDFNPRSPCGERQYTTRSFGECPSISIHAPRAGSDDNWRGGLTWVGISIHAPRAGSDGERLPLPLPVKGISIHAPRAGSDKSASFCAVRPVIFQSTLPVRGATDYFVLGRVCGIFQSTLPVRGATEIKIITVKQDKISIHAPRAGSDYMLFNTDDLEDLFQSTLPVRGATPEL